MGGAVFLVTIPEDGANTSKHVRIHKIQDFHLGFEGYTLRTQPSGESEFSTQMGGGTFTGVVKDQSGAVGCRGLGIFTFSLDR